MDLCEVFRTVMGHCAFTWHRDQPLMVLRGRQLFTVAGLAPMILGGTYRDGSERASVQSCLRMNAWDQIGRSGSHHVFFKMLGHFSLAAREPFECKNNLAESAILFLQEIGMHRADLRVSLHPDDEESAQIWERLGFTRDQITAVREKHTADFIPGRSGYRTKIGTVRPDGRIVRFWDLVSIEFDDDSYSNRSVRSISESGMSLDRLCAAREAKNSDYETSLWQPAITHAARSLNLTQASTDVSRFADCAVAVFMLLDQGLTPGPHLHGYVLRKLLRECCALSLIHECDSCAILAEMHHATCEMYGLSNPYEMHRAVIEAEHRKVINTVERAKKLALEGHTAQYLRETIGVPDLLLPRIYAV